MIAAVADTHAALWYLFGDERLSAPAKTFIDRAAQNDEKIVISAISLAEIIYLTEKTDCQPQHTQNSVKPSASSIT